MRGSRSLGLALVAATLGVAPAIAQQSNTAAAPATTPPSANSEMAPRHNDAAAMPGANTHMQAGSTTAATDQNQPAANSAAPAPANTTANATPPASGSSNAAPPASTANANPPATENNTNPAPANTAATTTQPVARTATANKGPSGSLQKYNGEWRSSKLVGATVYNDHGDDIGKIDDLLMNDQGNVETVVISTGGGVLGIGAKLVSVPFSQVKFEPSVNNSAPVAAGTPGSHPANSTAPRGSMATTTANNETKTDYSVVLPGATQKSLSQQSEFKYASTD